MIEQSRLEAMDNSKLIDIVKNYRQYGYDDTLRNNVLEILESRDIQQDELKLAGNFTNYKYDKAEDLVNSFLVNSRRAFVLYIVTIVSGALCTISNNPAAIIYLAIYLLSLALFFLFMIRSMISRNDFYKTIDKELSFGDYLIYILSGISIYLFMYFYYKSQMKEEMKMIN